MDLPPTQAKSRTFCVKKNGMANATPFETIKKSFAEFAARYGGEQFGSFFAATCAWQKILCAERVFFRPFMGEKARVGAISIFVKKGYALF